jgi:putative transposase
VLLNKEAAGHARNNFATQWCTKYGYAINSWKNNWEALTNYFDYPLETRKIIYTTNVIESLNSRIKKFTRAKCPVPIIKAVSLFRNEYSEKVGVTGQRQGNTVNQLSIIFENKCRL